MKYAILTSSGSHYRSILKAHGVAHIYNRTEGNAPRTIQALADTLTNDINVTREKRQDGTWGVSI